MLPQSSFSVSVSRSFIVQRDATPLQNSCIMDGQWQGTAYNWANHIRFLVHCLQRVCSTSEAFDHATTPGSKVYVL